MALLVQGNFAAVNDDGARQLDVWHSSSSYLKWLINGHSGIGGTQQSRWIFVSAMGQVAAHRGKVLVLVLWGGGVWASVGAYMKNWLMENDVVLSLRLLLNIRPLLIRKRFNRILRIKVSNFNNLSKIFARWPRGPFATLISPSHRYCLGLNLRRPIDLSGKFFRCVFV